MAVQIIGKCVESNETLMTVLPASAFDDADSSPGVAFCCFVLDKQQKHKGFIAVVHEEGNLRQFSTEEEALEEGLAFADLEFRWKV
jgi:hypothetical protein